MDQAHDCADDTHGRRVAAHAFEYFRSLNIAGFLRDEIHFKNAANRGGFCTVDQQLQALARITVGLGIGYGFQTQQALFARSHAPADDPVDTAGQIDTWRKNDPVDDFHGTHERVHRRLQQRSTECTAQHDQRRRTIEQGTEVPAFEKITTNDCDKRQDQTDKAQYIHQRQASTRCRPMSSRL